MACYHQAVVESNRFWNTAFSAGLKSVHLNSPNVLYCHRNTHCYKLKGIYSTFYLQHVMYISNLITKISIYTH